MAAVDNNIDRYSFNVPVHRRGVSDGPHRLQPDRQSSLQHLLELQLFTDYPDTLNNVENSYPGFPVQAGQDRSAWSWSNSVRSTIRRTSSMRPVSGTAARR